MKAPWPAGAVVGDVLDLPAVPVWAVGKCKQVEDDVELTIGVLLTDKGDDPLTGNGTGEALPPVDSGEGEGIGQPLPVIEPFEEYLGEPVKAKGKHK
ncbi:MAG: hypothetical protein Q7T78_17045 [Rhodoferax sp.]|nr:hypothetical protein [Rhodoferax sp.]